MKVFVTNLPESTDRRRHILSQVEAEGLDFEFVECVVGRDLTDREIEAACDLDAIRKHNRDRNWFNRGLIGAAMTSQKIHRTIVERGYETGLLLEDDVILPAGFRSMIEEIGNIVRPGDVVLLSWLTWGTVELDTSTEVKLGKFSLFEPVDPYAVSGGAATVFTASAARGILKVNVPIRNSPDSWGAFKEAGSIGRLLCAHPLPVEFADFASTLYEGRFVKVRRFLVRNKIFPFHQIFRWFRSSRRRVRRSVVFR